MKKLVFSLLITIIYSTVTAQNGNHFEKMEYNPETGKLSRARKFLAKEFAWNRPPEYDVLIETPWFNNKKLEVNLDQLFNIVSMGINIICIGFCSLNSEKNQPSYLSHLLSFGVLSPLAYKFFAGQQKLPFKIVEEKETPA